MPYRESNWTVHLKVGDVDLGYWAELEGGGVDSEDGEYDDWDGTIALGGKRTREDITLRKAYREQVHSVFRWLDARAGNGQTGRCVVTRTPVDDSGVSWGNPIVITGVLKGVKPPDVNKGSSDAGTLEVTIKCDANLA